ncbi:MFS transporter [Paraburkholderia sp. CNPSo 3274]|uniref:MFS transporter n=1 Tax=Paraburkholderia sp. CNPSo 3274 TaxID=2940932 RepID=UPI0020B7D1F4|nr:MFS transporter [Paraburkholderia sp. CNPSo 3274]MCP3707061.1 MFS transporter [Paraburkholderia sp. CNPSo 3274]
MSSPRQVFLMALCCALAVSPIYYHQPLLPQIASTFAVPSARGSLIATLTQLGYAIGLLLFVPLADGVQPRKLATRAIIANAVALLACAAAPSFAALVLCSFLVGMTSISAQIIIPAVSGMATPETRGRVVGSLLGGLSSGVLLARTLSGIVGALWGWRSIFVIASAIDIGLLFVIRELPVSNSLAAIRYRELMHSLADLVRKEGLLRLSATMGFLVFAAFSALWATLAVLLARSPYHYGPATIGAFGLIGVAGLSVSPQLGAIVDRVGARRVATAGALTVAISFAFVAAGGRSLAWLIVGMVLLDLGNRASFIANQARIYALRPEARSRLNTVFMVSYFLGGAFGAALGGAGALRAAWLGLAAIGALLSLAAVVVNTLAYARSRSAVADGHA